MHNYTVACSVPNSLELNHLTSTSPAEVAAVFPVSFLGQLAKTKHRTLPHLLFIFLWVITNLVYFRSGHSNATPTLQYITLAIELNQETKTHTTGYFPELSIGKF